MRVWLDDIRPMPAEYDIHVKTAHECIELLRQGNVTAISLDHDLGDGEGVGDGYQVAQFIEESAFLHSRGEGGIPPLRLKIHSQNPVGRDKMAQACQNAKRFWYTLPANG